MARLTLEQVHHVAQLAALSLDEADARRLCDDLGVILEHMAALDAVDVSQVEPTFHPLQSAAPLRTDRVECLLTREELMAAAPETDQGGFAVPLVRDGGG